MPFEDKNRKLTPPQLARRWGVSPAKVVALIKRGELRAINLALSQLGRPRFAIDPDDVAAFEHARLVKPVGGSLNSPPRGRRPNTPKDYF